MYHTLEEFLEDWRREVQNTTKLFSRLTDDSLSGKVWAEGRTMRTLAWHIVSSVSEMMGRVGFVLDDSNGEEAEPSSADEIREGYRARTSALDQQLQEKWNDASLAEEHDMYGQMWSNATTLKVLVTHEIHHRGQLTVLMRLV